MLNRNNQNRLVNNPAPIGRARNAQANQNRNVNRQEHQARGGQEVPQVDNRQIADVANPHEDSASDVSTETEENNQIEFSLTPFQAVQGVSKQKDVNSMREQQELLKENSTMVRQMAYTPFSITWDAGRANMGGQILI